ncbi:MAG: helix-turn-helix transcriptional regulator [Bacteroidaceae bacterium]|nr:helix-turn-helix transcriptional regulator [Bacteroidaceae bacterium]
MKLRIKEIMQEKGVTSASLSTMVGIHKVSVSNIINGKLNPSTETLEKIAEALGVEMWELFKSKSEIMEEIAEEKKNTVPCPYCGKPIDISLLKIEK